MSRRRNGINRAAAALGINKYKIGVSKSGVIVADQRIIESMIGSTFGRLTVIKGRQIIKLVQPDGYVSALVVRK